jgi:replication factor C large subunit
MLFTQKYTPQKIDDITGNDEAREKIKQWVYNWFRGQKKRPLLIWGPPGIGKTGIAYALKSEHDLELIEMGASDIRNKSNVERVLHGSMLAGSLFGKKKILLIDDVDAIQGRADYGGMAEVVRIAKENSYPIIITAIDAWEKNLAPLRMECELVPMKKVNKSNISKLLSKIAIDEKLEITDEKIEEIASNCDGDVRSAINDLQALSSSLRDRERDMFDRMKTVFKSRTYDEARKASSGDVEYDMLKLWVEENIPIEYETVEDIAKAFDALSRANIFQGRIRNTNWGYLKYCIDLTTSGVALAKAEVYKKYTKYNFPNYLREMSRSIQRRAMLKSVGTKIGLETHCNKRDALDYMLVVKESLKKNYEGTKKLYKLEDEEAAFISNY